MREGNVRTYKVTGNGVSANGVSDTLDLIGNVLVNGQPIGSGGTGGSGLGPTGPTGPAGSNGSAGINGATGATGPAGSNGTSGINGATGSDGTSGVNGATGSDGTSGLDGSAGIDGTSGVNGATGSDGTSGLDGLDGSAGIDGTSGINGATGATGPAGSDGTSGVNGATGSDGTSGLDGLDGLDGSAGIDGTSGINGATGSDGTSGLDGLDGSAGIDGTSGINGATGSDGATGPDGNLQYVLSTGNTASIDIELYDDIRGFTRYTYSGVNGLIQGTRFLYDQNGAYLETGYQSISYMGNGIKYSNDGMATNVLLKVPNKPDGIYTFATMEDLSASNVSATPSDVYLTDYTVQNQLTQTEVALILGFKVNKLNIKDLYQTGLIRTDIDTSILSLTSAESLEITNCDRILFVNEVFPDNDAQLLSDYIKDFGTKTFVCNGANTPLALDTRGIYFFGVNKSGDRIFNTTRVYDQDICYLARVLIQNVSGTYSIVNYKYFPDIASNPPKEKDRNVKSSGRLDYSGAGSRSFKNTGITYTRNSINYSNNRFDPNHLVVPDSTLTSFIFVLPNVANLSQDIIPDTVIPAGPSGGATGDNIMWYDSNGVGTRLSDNFFQIYKVLLTTMGTIVIQVAANSSEAQVSGGTLAADLASAKAKLRESIFPDLLPAGDTIEVGRFYMKGNCSLNGSQMADDNIFYFQPTSSSSSSSSVGATDHSELTGRDSDPTYLHSTSLEKATWNAKADQSLLLNTTSPLQGGGNLSGDRTLSILQSNTSQSGYLSSSDWNSFNNKQSLLTNPVTGTGSTNSMVKFINSDTIGDSSITNDGGLVTIYKPGEASYLKIKGDSDGDNFSVLELSETTNGTKWQIAHNSSNDLQFGYDDDGWSFPLKIKKGGNILINGGVGSASNTLQVDGTIIASSDIKTNSGIYIGNILQQNIFNNSDDITTLRNSNQVYTIMQIESPTTSDILIDDRESTLALMRTDGTNAEFLDLYNNGYGGLTASGRAFGIRMQKRGGGLYRDFNIEYSSGINDVTNVLKLNKDMFNVSATASFSKNLRVNGFLGVGVDPTYHIHVKSSTDAAYLKIEGVSDGDNFGALELANTSSTSKWQFAHKSNKDFIFNHFDDSVGWTSPLKIKNDGDIQATNTIEANAFITTGGTTAQFIDGTGALQTITNKVSAVIPNTGWVLVSGFYEYDYANVNINSSSIVYIIPDNTSVATIQTAQMLPKTDSFNGYVKLYSTNIPTSSINVTLNIGV
jgi:hypothetical protein